ncbi:MAG: hypothetical protein HRU41_35745 [Saprospiraceae bacterium]|nr:hypothetical protein [Saprospiraceae bacterium]
MAPIVLVENTNPGLAGVFLPSTLAIFVSCDLSSHSWLFKSSPATDLPSRCCVFPTNNHPWLPLCWWENTKTGLAGQLSHKMSRGEIDDLPSTIMSEFTCNSDSENLYLGP